MTGPKTGGRSRRLQFAPASFPVVLLLSGCSRGVPKRASEAVTLMTRYNGAGRYDDAIRLAQDWVREHPDDASDKAFMYQQMGFTYLSKAIRDPAHKDQWIQQAVVYFDEDLSIHPRSDGDIELFLVGRGFESAGHYSTINRCVYYGRAVKAFEDEVPNIQGDTITLAGTTVKLAPIRQQNEKALERAKLEFTGAGCK